MSTAELFRAEVMRQFADTLDKQIAEGILDDFTPANAEAVARAAGNSVSREARFRKRFGKFYRIDRTREALGGISRQAVHKRVHAHRILRVVTRDGMHLYPAFQFIGEGKIEPIISEIVSTLGNGGMDDWSILYWLTKPIKLPNNSTRTAVEIAYDGDGESIDHLRQLAFADSVSWISSSASPEAMRAL